MPCRTLLLPCLLVTAALSLVTGSTALAAVYAEAGAELQHNDNLGRSLQSPVSGSGVRTQLNVGYQWQPGVYTGFGLQAQAGSSIWEGRSALNHLEAGVGATLSHKFGIGAERPVLRLHASVQQQRYDLDLRDARISTLGASISRRVGDRLSLRLGWSVEDHAGDYEAPFTASENPAGLIPKGGRIWDYQSWTLSAAAEFDLGARSWLTGSFDFRDGDVVSTALQYTRRIPGVRAAGYDPAFGAHAVSYRLDARTRMASLEFNLALAERATWYTGIEWQAATASSGARYDTGLLRSGLLYSF